MQRLTDERLDKIIERYRYFGTFHDLRFDDDGDFAMELAAFSELRERRAKDREREMRQSTHHAECWRDPAHHACAVARIEKAREIIAKHAAMDKGKDDFDLGWVRCATALLNHFDAAMRGE